MALKWELEVYSSLPSTQDEIQKREAAPEGLVIQALQQIKGRGRYNRPWHHGAGNLAMSVLLRPGCQALALGQLSLLCGAAVGEALHQHMAAKNSLKLKWPNDVMLEGKKCAGILLDSNISEERINRLVVGIGVNIKSAPSEEFSALHDYSTRALTADLLRDSILDRINHHYGLWREQGFQSIKESWLKLSYKEGMNMQVKLRQQIYEGTFSGIGDNGNLLLKSHEGQLVKITAGDVFLK